MMHSLFYYILVLPVPPTVILYMHIRFLRAAGSSIGTKGSVDGARDVVENVKVTPKHIAV